MVDRHGGETRRAQRVRRRMALLMLVAILPSLTFLGHVSFHIDLPGTALYVGLPSPAGGHHEGDGEPAEHERHCHAGVASCSEVPFAGASAFLLLQESASMLGAAALLVLVVAVMRQPAGVPWRAPLAPPPRFAA